MLRRAIGVALLALGLSGIAISMLGTRLVDQVLDDLGKDLENSLQLVSESLDRLESSLLLAKTTLTDVGDALSSSETAMVHLARSTDETRPLLSQITIITTDEVPVNIEAMQEAVPGMVQVAALIDDTLSTLSAFRIDRQILGIDIQFDLGVKYDPETPFDESVQLVGESLDGLPEQLRDLKSNLDATSENMALLSQDLDEIASDLNTVNGRLTETEALIDEYLSTILDISDGTRQMRASVNEQLGNVKGALTLFSIWLGLSQLLPLYLGWELARGRRPR